MNVCYMIYAQNIFRFSVQLFTGDLFAYYLGEVIAPFSLLSDLAPMYGNCLAVIFSIFYDPTMIYGN